MDREFHRISGNSVSVPFMRSYERQYIEAYDGFKVLRIPYRQGGVDNNPIFPYRQGRVNNSRSFPYLQKLMLPITASLIDKALSVMLPVPVSLLDKNDGLDDLVKAMASNSGFLDYHVPRFKVLVKEFRISKFKIAYGLDGKDLGLSSMALYHKACVEIDEEGAEAAAATFAAPKPGMFEIYGAS
ncbi:Serine protease inhibitor (SERPIN) family protein [Raphanus sativus]|nr:Serine protease inhibitor (SERPIN) family protein [Raphanus sativus]